MTATNVNAVVSTTAGQQDMMFLCFMIGIFSLFLFLMIFEHPKTIHKIFFGAWIAFWTFPAFFHIWFKALLG